MNVKKLLTLTITATLLTAGVIYAAFQAATPTPTPLSTFVPQGSLLAIEAPDFASLLNSWTHSSQQRAWLTSDNYTAFSRSRLFSRLADAQSEFATSAGLPPDLQFLQQIAGTQSIFAWYDIGNLQFLYITRMPSAAAQQTQLLQLRTKFQLRKAGDDSFYIRTQGEPKRTVAFATHGDYLLLATREDLLASALLLMQHPADASLHTEPWYTTSVAAAAPSAAAPNLRMTLNLTLILPTPYFRSYWIQQNISELKQFTAAISDLYLTPETFREERSLIPTSTDTSPTSDLAPILQILSANVGVYRATAHPTTSQILEALDTRLLSRSPATFRDQHLAPVADLSTPNPGTPTDLDTRIDTQPIPQQPLTVALAPLRTLLDAASPTAMLVYATTTGPTSPSQIAASLFLPIHNAVILSSITPWNSEALKSALSAALSPHLTVGSTGLIWQTSPLNPAITQLTGLHTLAFAIQGNHCILATDSETLAQLLHPAAPAPQPIVASSIAGFHHNAEHANLSRLTRTLDHTSATPQTEDSAPPFFSRNLVSLSSTFQSLDSETFTETPTPATPQRPATIHQTVLYQWQP